MQMTDAYIGLGSNLGDPEDQLQRAIESLKQLPHTTVLKVSSLYRTKPVGPEGQADYINAVVLINTGLSARDLLKHMQKIEDNQGRIRTERWGPRTLDLDLLLFGQDNINEKHLVVPHPEIHKRGFVLFPLHEISPGVSIPGHGLAGELLHTVNPDDVQKL